MRIFLVLRTNIFLSDGTFDPQRIYITQFFHSHKEEQREREIVSEEEICSLYQH